jgi:hypothetical protein
MDQELLNNGIGIVVGSLGMLELSVLAYTMGKEDIKRTIDKVQDYFWRPISGKKAILIEGDNSRSDDINIMDDLLKGYGYDRKKFGQSVSTKKDCLEYIDHIASTLNQSDNSNTLIYFTGHGFIRYKDKASIGILLNGKDTSDENYLTPKELWDHIKHIKGNTAVIIDSCHSGTFPYQLSNLFESKTDPSAEKESFIVLASCPALNLSLMSKDYIPGLNLGALTYGIYRSLKCNKGSFNLSSEVIHVGNEVHRSNPSRILPPSVTAEYKLSFEPERFSAGNFYL